MFRSLLQENYGCKLSEISFINVSSSIYFISLMEENENIKLKYLFIISQSCVQMTCYDGNGYSNLLYLLTETVILRRNVSSSSDCVLTLCKSIPLQLLL